MTTAHQPAGPVTDRDRRRACRLAHAFGAAAAAAVVLLAFLMTRFRAEPVPVPVLLAAGPALALAVGLAADLVARPPRVLLGGDWLAISRLGHRQRVHTGRLAGLSANPRVAGSIVLLDEDGNRAEIDVRVLVRNPVIWQRVRREVSRARRRGALELAGADAKLWESVNREVADADQRALASLDFAPPR